jgi:hypothetical protein
LENFLRGLDVFTISYSCCCESLITLVGSWFFSSCVHPLYLELFYLLCWHGQYNIKAQGVPTWLFFFAPATGLETRSSQRW